MPLYAFSCSGGHAYDRRVGYGEFTHPCLIEKCRETARASEVNRINNTHPRFWGGELPRQAREAIDTHLHHKGELAASVAEEEGNGWSPGYQPRTF